jgi:uncharacterized cupin superfamily protein
MSGFQRGRLRTSDEAPVTGELSQGIVSFDYVSVEQIVSGALAEPVHFNQDHGEWVVVLAGSAVLEVEDERLTLEPGDWVFLPAQTPHRLIDTRPGTNWLAVHSTR